MSKSNSIEAVYSRTSTSNENPPVAPTTEGQSKAVRASARSLYPFAASNGKSAEAFSKRGSEGSGNERYLFEQPYRGHLWRLEVQTFRGRTFGNWRKWYRKGDEWKPTKEGFTFPLDRLADLTESLMAYHGLEPANGMAC